MTLVWTGITLGAIYAIIATGYNIVFVASRVFNFAQPQFLMLGAFVGLFAGTRLHLPLPLTILLCAVVGGLVGALEEVLAVRRLYGRGTHNELITTLGVSTMLSGAALVVFGSEPQSLPYFQGESSFDLLGGRIAPSDIAIVATAAVLMAATALVMRRTTVGLSSLAASEDREAATLHGINVRRLALGAFIVAGAMVAAAGPIVAAKTYAGFDLGDNLAVKGFVALVIGGFGSQGGAVIGGLVVGLLDVFAARYLGTDWRNVSIFLVLLVVMMARPNGFLGARAARAV
jgi:branched-chain amino acid transport system permease protein